VHALKFLLKLKTYACGDIYIYMYIYIQQKMGIPIGGPVSGEILTLVLAKFQHEYMRTGWVKWRKNGE